MLAVQVDPDDASISKDPSANNRRTLSFYILDSSIMVSGKYYWTTPVPQILAKNLQNPKSNYSTCFWGVQVTTLVLAPSG